MEMSEMELRLIDPGKHRTLKILHMITTFMHFQHDRQNSKITLSHCTDLFIGLKYINNHPWEKSQRWVLERPVLSAGCC